MTPNASRLSPGVNTELAKPTWLPAVAVLATSSSVRPFTAGKSAAVAFDAAASSAVKSFFETPGGGLGVAESEPPQPAASSAAATASERTSAARAVIVANRSDGPVVDASAAALHADALEHVGDVLTGVDGGLERLEDVLPADHDHRVDPRDEQRGDRVAAEAVGLVLEPVDLDAARPHLAAVSQRPQREADLLTRGDQDVGEQTRVLHRRLDPVDAEHVCGLLGVVDDVVERGRELEALERVHRLARPAAVVQALDDVVGDAVARVLAVDQIGRELAVIGPVGEQVAKEDRRPLHRSPRLLEELEHTDVAGRVQQGHAPTVTMGAAIGRGVHRPFTAASLAGHGRRARGGDPGASWRRHSGTRTRSGSARSRSIRPRGWPSRTAAR